MTDKPARPWDIFNKNIDKVPEDVYNKRISICEACPQFINTTKQCKICFCIMTAKARLPHADCPQQKWKKYVIPIDREI